MKNTTLTEPGLPQLRQMVLENTERINKNEMMINRMRMENHEQSRKISERDDYWENSRKEHDRQMRSINATLDRVAQMSEAYTIERERASHELDEKFKETDKRIEKNRRESDARIEEYRKKNEEEIKAFSKASDERIEKNRKESDARIEEYRKKTEEEIKAFSKASDERIEERWAKIEKLHEENEKLSEQARKEFRQFKIEFYGITTHISEGLVSSSTEKIFQQAGFDLQNSGKNIKRKLTAKNKQMEIDVLLSNDKLIIPVEVKSNCAPSDVDWFLHQMGMFRELFPESDDKEVIAAIAALNYEDKADIYAHEHGLLVIRVNSDDIFSIDPVDRNTLHKF